MPKPTSGLRVKPVFGGGALGAVSSKMVPTAMPAPATPKLMPAMVPLVVYVLVAALYEMPNH